MKIANDRIIKTYFNGEWLDGNQPILGAADHATWLGTLVFDGARRFRGLTPDLDLHCKRLIASAKAMALVPELTGEEIEQIIREGLKLIPDEHDLYIRPMMWSLCSGDGFIEPVPDLVGFAICLEEIAMPKTVITQKLGLSPYRRPTIETAIANAKAASLYANSGRIIADARARGFHNAVALDGNSNVAETASTNLFIVKDGVVQTPIPNGTFLAGITRARVIKLLRNEGVTVEEVTLTVNDLHQADELFITANFAKVAPVTQFEDRIYPATKIGTKAHRLYFEWAQETAG